MFFSKRPPLLDEFFLKIKDYIKENTGIQYYQDKDEELAQKITNRFLETKTKTFKDYFLFLTNSESSVATSEFDYLVSDLTIGETYFFREIEVFNKIEQIVLPDLFEKNKDTKIINIWSAGCATGEEAYTLSMILHEKFPHAQRDWKITITGSDINRVFLRKAENGSYSDWAMRKMPDEYKKKCFVLKNNMWQILPKYKENVIFIFHNLIKNSIPSMLHNLYDFDLIFFRNVMIYFDAEVNASLSKKIYECLKPDGFLMVGPSDHNKTLTDLFKSHVYPNVYFYQKSAHLNKEASLDLNKFLKRDRPLSKIEDIKIPVFKNSLSADQPVTENERIRELWELSSSGQWQSALDFSEKIFEKEKINPDFYFIKGLIYIHAGKYIESEEMFVKALYLDPKYVPAYYQLGLVNQREKNKRKAIKYFENVLQILNKLSQEIIFEFADNISSGQLKELTSFNLEILRGKSDESD